MTVEALTILHISADYPDPLVTQKTRAVSNLLTLVPEHTHYVYSLNRVGCRDGVQALDFADEAGKGHRAVAYGGAPKGLFLKHYLDRLTDWIADDLARRKLLPDLVHAHKLSIEGLVGATLAKRLGVALAISIQGNSDLKVMNARRDLTALWQDIWHDAAVTFPFAPWAANWLAGRLGGRCGPVRLLPCPDPADNLLPPKIVGPIFRSAFHMSDHLPVNRNKNAERLIRAIGLAARRVPQIRLEIIGGGDATAFARLAIHGDRVAPGRVRFLGAVPNAEIQKLFNASCAFALAPHRESFGMVFVEALLAGCPCLISRGWGIDGYLEDGEALLAVPSRDVTAIAEGLVQLAREEGAFKAPLARLAKTGGLDLFRRDAIAAVYRAGLAEAIARRRHRQPGLEKRASVA
jgi:glycosyltransferase involved in cell wall biosynthesis